MQINNHTGFDQTTGVFEPMSVLGRSRWEFLYRLHGSIHFAMTGAGSDLHHVTWTGMPQKDHTVHSFGRNVQDSTEGVAYPISPIVAGYGKTQQILREPFRTYFAQANRLVYEADSLLFLGYGFGDLHLNAALSEVQNRRDPVPVVIIDWAGNDQDPLPARMDAWDHNLRQTLPINVGRMGASIADLKRGNEFEVSQDENRPLAVWYNGLLEACKHPHKVLAHLGAALPTA